MQINPDKIVNFHEYCAECVYFDKEEKDDPCFECLENPVNEFSHRPVYFKEKEKKMSARG